MKILTYHGDETITRLFTTSEKAIAYAVAEVGDCTSIMEQAVKVYTDKKDINAFADADTIEAVILDQELGDFRIYTVEDANVDEKYIVKYS